MASRSYVFTHYAPKLDPSKFDDNIKYVVWQQERGSEAGKLHLQGYMELHKKVRIPQAVGWLGAGKKCKLAPRKGTRDEARAYCMKEDTRVEGPWEHGVWSKGQGERTELKRAAAAILEGKAIYDVAIENPIAFVRSGKGLQQLAEMAEYKRKKTAKQEDELRKVRVEVHWGAPGTGKTRFATSHADHYVLPTPKDGQMMFNGYIDQQVLILDEFLPSRYPITELNKVLDIYPYQARKLYGTVWAKWTLVIITSNIDPQEWYTAVPDTVRAAFFDRINLIKHYEGESKRRSAPEEGCAQSID